MVQRLTALFASLLLLVACNTPPRAADASVDAADDAQFVDFKGAPSLAATLCHSPVSCIGATGAVDGGVITNCAGTACWRVSAGGGGSLDGAVVSVTGTAPITTTDDAGYVNVAIGLIAIDGGTKNQLPPGRLVACTNGLTLVTVGGVDRCAYLPAGTVSTDGGVDGGLLTNCGGVACWSANGVAFTAGGDLVGTSTDQVVQKAQNGHYIFGDGGSITCALGDKQCTLGGANQTSDLPPIFAAIGAGAAYGDASTNVVGGPVYVLTGNGANRDGGIPGAVDFGPDSFIASTQPVTAMTTNATPLVKTIFVLPSNTAGTITAIITGKLSGSATHITQTWQCGVSNTSGTCAVSSTGGACAASASAMSTGTVGSISVALSGCNIQATDTGTAVDGGTWNWVHATQYVYAGP